MLLIDAQLKEAGKKGIGVFAQHFIAKGTLVWMHEPMFHKKISVEEFQCLDPRAQAFVRHYATLEKEPSSYYYLDLDNTRFINHSNCPNIEFTTTEARALRDIEAGEELTCDYLTIYEHIWFDPEA